MWYWYNKGKVASVYFISIGRIIKMNFVETKCATIRHWLEVNISERLISFGFYKREREREREREWKESKPYIIHDIIHLNHNLHIRVIVIFDHLLEVRTNKGHSNVNTLEWFPKKFKIFLRKWNYHYTCSGSGPRRGGDMSQFCFHYMKKKCLFYKSLSSKLTIATRGYIPGHCTRNMSCVSSKLRF